MHICLPTVTCIVHPLGTGHYNPAATTLTIMYGPSQFGWNLLATGSSVFSKTLLKTRSPARNACNFTCMLYRFVCLCWYDAILTVAASHSSFFISKSLAMASTLVFQEFQFEV